MVLSESMKHLNLMKISLKNYNIDSDERYFLEIDVQYLRKLHDFHNDLPILPERMKIGKVEKLVAKLNNKHTHDIHKRNVKKALKH